MTKKTTLSLISIVALCGCATNKESSSTPATLTKPAAVAVISPLGTNSVHGTINFVQDGEAVRVQGTLEGLSPGLHGFHIHEKGDCSAKDGSSAGPHFNPTKAPHGGPTSAQHHAGDFGNIEANGSGVAKINNVFTWLSLHGENSIIGRGLIVHANPDDMQSQPAGNAGGRIGCGVIQSTQ
jgi:Cu-Zn family superoxide dismutase